MVPKVLASTALMGLWQESMKGLQKVSALFILQPYFIDD
jgi:hypothetical protein